MHSFFTTLRETISAGGMLLVPMLIVGLGIWAYLLRTREGFRRALQRRDNGTPPTAVCEAIQHAETEAAQAIPDLGAYDRHASTQMACLRREIRIVAAYTAAAPLLGLLGTVVGMMETFSAVSSSMAVSETQLAAGIQRALVTTQFGLLLALPGVFGTGRMRRLLDRLRIELALGRTAYLLRGVDRRQAA